MLAQILRSTQSHQLAVVEVVRKIHLLGMVALAVAHHRQAVEQLLELELLVREKMAVQVLAMLRMTLALAVAVALAQTGATGHLKLAAMVAVAQRFLRLWAAAHMLVAGAAAFKIPARLSVLEVLEVAVRAVSVMA
jgi:hypothetical protein